MDGGVDQGPWLQERVGGGVGFRRGLAVEQVQGSVKDALWGGGGTRRSWPGGRGGRPRALIPGEGVREGLAWRGKAVGTHWSWLGGRGVREAGARASVPGA